MLNASGPQAGQHGDSRAVEKCLGVDSVLRADPQAPRAHVDMLAAVRSGSQERPRSRFVDAITKIAQTSPRAASARLRYNDSRCVTCSHVVRGC